MPPRKKRAAPASKKAQPAAAHKAAAVKKAATARRGAQAAPVEPVGVTAPAVVAAPAPVPAKNQVEVEVNLHPTENGNIRLEFDIGRGDESANLSPKRTLRDAFLATCRLQGVEDAEVVKCTDPNGKAAASLTLGKVLGDTDDTFCLVTFRSALVCAGSISSGRRGNADEAGDSDDGGGGYGWGYASAF